MEIVLPLFLIILAAVLGGVAAKLLKFPPLVGYIVAGLVFGMILPAGVKNIARLSEIGTILLLFSIGVELSFTRLSKFFNVAILGSLIQITVVTALAYFLLKVLGFGLPTSLILAAGFSLSSTAVVVKILGDRGEMDSLHGGIMFGWLLVQDLAVVPMMVALSSSGFIIPSILKALLVVAVVVVGGRMIVPFLIHKVALSGSRELLTLSSVSLALGTAAATSYFGISPSLGAFLAGVVISESQEHHAVFAETRPLRDLFVALFFVSLGFLVTPAVVFSNLGIILLLAFSVVILKILVIFLISGIFGFRGRVAIANSFGLAQVGEFAFVIYSASLALGLIRQTDATIGIAVGLATLLFTPFLFTSAVPVWRKLKRLGGLFSSGEKRFFNEQPFKGHIIICGYGRVGSWVGRALADLKIPFVVVEYNLAVVGELKEKGIPVLYGDPGEVEILDSLDIKDAKAVVLAIPDTLTQENLIAHIQTRAPDVKIISRVHQDADWEKLKNLRVDKLVQPEFEAAIAITRSILVSMGKPKEEILAVIKSLRVSHSK